MQHHVKLLLDEGADPNEVARNGHSALYCAALMSRCGVVKLLMQRGAVPTAEERQLIVSSFPESTISIMALNMAPPNDICNIM